MTPYLGLERDQNLRPDSSLEKLAKLKPVFGEGREGDDDRGQLDPADRRRRRPCCSASDEWAEERSLPVLAHLVDAETGAVDFVHGDEGLLGGAALRGAAAARPQRPGAAGLRLLRDPRGVRLAGADDAEGVGRTRRSAPSGSAATSRSARSTRAKLNVNGSSLAAGHPFAATGGRIVATLAKLLHERGSGRGLISICAAGGQGVTAILEKSG